MFTDAEPQRVAKGVLDRLDEAVHVPLREFGTQGRPEEPGWHPQPKYCHYNVVAWVYRNPQHKHGKGYLVFDFRPLLRERLIQAHSVVELEDGSLIDITPSHASQSYPFVRHIGTDEEFVEMARVMSVRVPTE
ncbi:MAG: hypothetical protein K2Y71_21175 [Xanthobacteraceae bacterium]|nr:hypothetical protein [Xanthobacteraceae bacterium]